MAPVRTKVYSSCMAVRLLDAPQEGMGKGSRSYVPALWLGEYIGSTALMQEGLQRGGILSLGILSPGSSGSSRVRPARDQCTVRPTSRHPPGRCGGAGAWPHVGY